MSTDKPPGGFRAATPPKGDNGDGVKINIPRRTTSKPVTSSTAARMTLPRIRARLAEFITTGAAFLTMREPFDGTLIANNAEKIADAYAPLIERNKRLQLMMMQLEKGGAYGAAITVTIGVAIPILIHHGKVPDHFLYLARMTGVSIPDHIPVTYTQPTQPLDVDASPVTNLV